MGSGEQAAVHDENDSGGIAACSRHIVEVFHRQAQVYQTRDRAHHNPGVHTATRNPGIYALTPGIEIDDEIYDAAAQNNGPQRDEPAGDVRQTDHLAAQAFISGIPQLKTHVDGEGLAHAVEYEHAVIAGDISEVHRVNTALQLKVVTERCGESVKREKK
jgi:hypothetical protein